jgi:predicted DNA-binding protein (MmcQ/YjbR family)
MPRKCSTETKRCVIIIVLIKTSKQHKFLQFMDIEKIREYALSLPYVTENVQWGNDLVFKVGEKMFLVINLSETDLNKLSFKCLPEKFAELIEQPFIIPAPYLARYHWITLQKNCSLDKNIVLELINTAYQTIYAKLPKKTKEQLKSEFIATK